jgi:hypothetical protein
MSVSCSVDDGSAIERYRSWARRKPAAAALSLHQVVIAEKKRCPVLMPCAATPRCKDKMKKKMMLEEEKLDRERFKTEVTLRHVTGRCGAEHTRQVSVPPFLFLPSVVPRLTCFSICYNSS